MTLEELRADFAAQGQPAFHALQVYRWLHRGVRSFSEMSDQSKAFRQKLSERYYIAAAEIEQRLVSSWTAQPSICCACRTANMWNAC